MLARVAPAQPPFDREIKEALDRLMPSGLPPLALFTTLARDKRLFERFTRGGLLDKGHLTLRQREIVIDRVTALCGSEYEWGVHVAFFAAKASLDASMLYSLVHGSAEDACWMPEEKVLIRTCDELHRTCALSDQMWKGLRQHFKELAIIEVTMLAGFYRTVSYLTGVLQLSPERGSARFPKCQ
jgi:alkylhydroperoxidase family enzyme